MIKFYKKDKIEEKINKESWKILIVDDEKDIHSLTKTLLKDLIFENKKIIFTSAYSGKEAFEIMKKENDFAVILLDVIMESDDAGLVFSSKLREQLNNHSTRIILRTGQVGTMHIKDVIRKFDINDFKEKTQLDSNNLYISIFLALRAFKDIKTITSKNYCLNNILTYSNELNKQDSLEDIIDLFLNNLTRLLKIDKKDIHKRIYTYDINTNTIQLLLNQKQLDNQEKRILLIRKLINSNEVLYKKDLIIFVIALDEYYMIVEYSNIHNENKMDKILIEIFIETSKIIMNNFYSKQRIIKQQEELSIIINKMIKTKSNNTSEHLNRVSKIAYLLAKEYGLNESDAKELKLASSLRDIGKTQLDILANEQVKRVEEHPKAGYDLLNEFSTSLLKQAAIIAYEHNESWDGSGYPRHLKEKEIHLYSRITSISDFYDSLRISRTKEQSWPKSDALNFLKKNSNIKFESELIELLIKNINQIEEIIQE